MSDPLLDVADRIYGIPPGGFVRARTDEARRARDEGDRDLAARIGALTKPSAAAALVNDLARNAPDDVARLLDLGATIREAQSDADRAALQRSAPERRRLIAEVASSAADRAAAQGRRPGAGVIEELQQTLQAALVDEAAGDAIRSGRLLRGLVADGVGEVDLERAVAVPGPLEPLVRRPRPGNTGRPDDGHDAALREAATAARLRATAADERVRTAASAQRVAEADALADEHEVAARRRTAEDAERALEAAERQRDESKAASDRARMDHDAARAESAEADRDVERAEAALTA